jgi:Family of unknown function (DUF6573)
MVIFSYTRAQAIADGVLVDVSELAKEAGFRFPVAVTTGVWAECVAVPDGVAGQDETGRLWDVLNVLRFAIQRGEARDVQGIDFAMHVCPDNLLDVLNKARYAVERPKSPNPQRVDFAVHVRNDNREGDPPQVKLYALCGPGDDSEPVITVMLPHED